MYDGHGSTRLLTDSSGTITDRMSYDAYGIMLGGNPTNLEPPTTNLLYSGEQFDVDLQQQYLRARYYDQSIGVFNRFDPFSGNNNYPQSLHKYTYTHNDPVNMIDPAGLFTLPSLLTSLVNSNRWMVGAYAARAIFTTFSNHIIQLRLIETLLPSVWALRDFARALQPLNSVGASSIRPLADSMETVAENGDYTLITAVAVALIPGYAQRLHTLGLTSYRAYIAYTLLNSIYQTVLNGLSLITLILIQIFQVHSTCGNL